MFKPMKSLEYKTTKDFCDMLSCSLLSLDFYLTFIYKCNLIVLKVAVMTDIKKKRSGNISPDQKELLIAFLAQNEDLRNNKFTSTFTHKHAQQKWQSITAELNAMPGGSEKSWTKWRKTWQDIRCQTKQKAAKERKHAKGTGGGKQLQLLNNDDVNVLNLLSQVSVEGDPEVDEGEVSFSFDNCQAEYLEDPDSSETARIYGQHFAEEESCPSILRPSTNPSLSQDIPFTTNGVTNCHEGSRSSFSTSTQSQGTHRTQRQKRSSKKDVRFTETSKFTNKIASISEEDMLARREYYAAKLKLMERTVIAQEKIASFCANVAVVLNIRPAHPTNSTQQEPLYEEIYMRGESDEVTYEDILQHEVDSMSE